VDFKDQMIERVERGWSTDATAYDDVRDAMLDAADVAYKQAKENGYRNPLVAPYFCVTCRYSENAHPRPECETGFVPGDADAVREQNRRRGFPS